MSMFLGYMTVVVHCGKKFRKWVYSYGKKTVHWCLANCQIHGGRHLPFFQLSTIEIMSHVCDFREHS